MHLLNLFNGFSPLVFVQVLYTFGLGLVLGIIYEYSERNFLYVFLFHFLFNFLNDFLYTRLFNLENDYVFYLVSVGNGMIIGIYILILFFLHKNKQKELTLDNFTNSANSLNLKVIEKDDET